MLKLSMAQETFLHFRCLCTTKITVKVNIEGFVDKNLLRAFSLNWQIVANFHKTWGILKKKKKKNL